ncbi:MAG: EF-Tu/IF-2/RF-3 family GTPase [Thermoplasmata archaeon]|nr:EF-Tu/IF-2/RF-3 family GTPase [Thermoplasmata archaeon]
MNTSMLCVLNSEILASSLGKKGTESDITLFNHKQGEKAISVVMPTRYPDKLTPLLYSLFLGSEIFMVIDKLDRTIGEELVACDVMGKTKGTIFLENYITPEQVKPLLNGTGLSDWQIVEGLGNPNEMREELMLRESKPIPGPTRVSIDHSFPVKGLGTVCLGIVDQGLVKKHQELTIYPTGKKSLVRSIQVHDNDVNEASSGNRVGLAMKGVEPEDIGRGTILAEEGVLTVKDSLDLTVSVNKFWKGTLKNGMVVHAASGLQFVSGTITMDGELKAGQSGKIQIKLETPMALADTDFIVICWLDAVGSRVVGKGIQ